MSQTYAIRNDDEHHQELDLSTMVIASNACLVLSPRAHRLPGDLLKDSGELLPVLVGDDTYYIFNILNTTDAIDPFSSKKIYNGLEMGVEKITF